MSLQEELLEKLGQEAFDERLSAKLKEYHQLIPRETALYLISVENGLGAPKVETLDKAVRSFSPVILHARIERVFPPRIVDKQGQSSRSQRVALSDQTGIGTLVVYDSATDPLETEFMAGDMLEAGPVRVRGGEFHLLGNGHLTRLQKGLREKIRPQNASPTSALIANYEGIVSAVFGDFPYRKGQAKLSGESQTALMTSFELKDDSGTARVVLWDSPGLAGRLKAGQEVDIENGTRRGGEIHINSAGRLLLPKMAPVQRPKIERIEMERTSDGSSFALAVYAGGNKTIRFTSLEDAASRLGLGPIPDGISAITMLELKKKDWIGKDLPLAWEEKKE